MVTYETITSGFKYFKFKNLKGRPDIQTKADLDEMVDMWCEALQDVDQQVFITACKMLSDELTFYPSFAEVRKKCDDLMAGKQEVATEVWSRYSKKMMAVHGAYANNEDRENLFNSIQCDITKETCKLFDWRAFGQSNENQELYHMREFEKIYKSVSERLKFNKSAERALIGTGKTKDDLLIKQPVAGLIENLTKGIGEVK